MSENASIVQGDDTVLQFTIYTDDTKTTAKDITGYTGVYRASWRRDTVLEKTNGVVSDGPNGVFEVTLLAAETVLLRPGAHPHQLQLTDTSSNDHTAVDGILTVRRRLPAV